MRSQLRKMENHHIILWLLKDFAWMLEWKWIACGIFIPTLALAWFITVKSRAIPSEFWHNLAVCAWLMANGSWMVSHLFQMVALERIAIMLFAIGLGVLTFYYFRAQLTRENCSSHF